MMFMHHSIHLLLLCSAGARWASAFLPGGALQKSFKVRDGSTKLNSQVSERTLPVSLQLAEEWAARNKNLEDLVNPLPASPPSDPFSMPSSSTTTVAPPPHESTFKPATHEASSEPPPHEASSKPAAISMSDLALEWAARNKDVDAVNGDVSTVRLSSSTDSVQVQIPPPADSTTQALGVETPYSISSSLDLPIASDTELPITKIISFDKELWFDQETGRFYEGPSTSVNADLMDPEISTPTRFASTHGGREALQKQLDDRNTIMEGEGQYAVADGELVGKMSAEERKALAAQTERLIQPRPYTLFLAEKAAEVVESSMKGFTKPFKGPKIKPMMYEYEVTEGKKYTRVSTRDGRKRVVILGSGWGAASFLKEIDTDLYDVTVISPRNHFVFTPMLAGASVGTVEYRSITEPIREINRQARFLEAIATDVDPETQLVTCQSIICDGNSCDICEFTVSYDRLVVTVGAQTNTFGIPGVRENCCFLKQVEDARRIRTAIVNCFERANLPGLTDEERKHDLTFAIIGAGPTGVEFAAELRDFVEQDGPKYYPNLVKHVRIKVIVSSSTVLAPFDKSLQQQAIDQMNRVTSIKDPVARSLLPARFRLTELLFESRVTEVTEKNIMLKDGRAIPYGLALWAAGNGPIPLTLHVVEALGEEQQKDQDVARGRIAVDPWMRAVGGKGKILAFGDCSCICQGGQQLPATAQVASQQGEYLAGLMNRRFDLSPPTTLSDGILPPPMRDPKRTKPNLSDRIAGISTQSKEYAKPFQFLNLGILAYTGGGSALAQVETAPQVPPVLGWGQVGNFLWRSVYLSKQVSWRNRILVVNDWAKKQLFGRDITRV